MPGQKRYLIPQGTVIVFYALFILFVVSCLGISGQFYLLQKELYTKQQEALQNLNRNINRNWEMNVNQNFSITELEKEIKKLKGD